MVKKVAHKISAVILSFVVLFSTMGMTMNAHYCHTSHELQKSILPFPISCDHQGMESCGITQVSDGSVHSCCAVIPENEPSQKPVLSEECCEDFFHFIKVITDFDLPQLKFKTLFNKFLALTMRLFELIAPSKASPGQTALLEIQNQPPSLFGKDLTISIHQLKLDTVLL
ncbi:MAG: hypothetical protein Q7V19_08145 [Bacteroidales bacterium]|nr:hypothetical protein [Bacteroidales bacterium]